jgi:predicted glycosyltransferase
LERRKRILVAPLDWGLGHATRCIPVIRTLLAKQFEVLLASNGGALALLKKEFPGLQSFELPGYNPTYPAVGSMVWKMAAQLPKFIKAIEQEYKAVQQIIKQHNIDAIISDNRYGCYSRQIKSVLIYHQLHLIMPPEWKWIETQVNHSNRERINKFDECWIPAPNAEMFAELQKGFNEMNTRHIGFLSRFEKRKQQPVYDLLVICSGPEPQRGVFEQMLIRQLKGRDYKAIIVGGRPGLDNTSNYTNANTELVGFMHTEALNQAVEASGVVIARSGYSTVMDMAKLEKKAIFVPTPGQTEQEYIAEELLRLKIAYSERQDVFDIERALKASVRYSGFAASGFDNLLLENAIDTLV